jgi:hypothetical protein
MKPAIGKLLDENGETLLGTAFVASPSHALTAFHCIGNSDTGEVWRQRVLLEFLTGDQIAGSYEVGSRVEDYAILSLQSPLPEGLEPVLLLDQAYPSEPFRAAGYPSSVHGPDNPDQPDISYIGGLVRAENTSIFGGAPAIQLYSDEGAAGLSLHGMSGGPVLVGQNPEGAVGLVRWNNPRKDAPELGVGGNFWACPIKLIVEEQSEYGDLVLHVRGPEGVVGDRTADSAQISSWRRMLSNKRDALRLIDERISEYVDYRAVPLELIRNRQRTEASIAELEARLSGR